MKHGFIKVAAVTPEIKVADPGYNAKEICNRLRDAYERGAKIIVFPELCITGYTCGDLFLQQLLLDEAMRALDVITKSTKDLDAIVMVGLPVENDGGLYNVAAVLQDGKVLGMVPKTNIPTYSEFYEGRHFTAGKSEVTYRYFKGEKIAFGGNLLFSCQTMPELVIGCEICEDLWVANPPSANLALRGATVIANLSASNETIGKDEYRQLLVQSASARAVCAYIYASAGEGESTQTLVFGGHNMVAENGIVLAQSKHFQGETIYTDIDLQLLQTERRRAGTFGKELMSSYVRIPFALQMVETKLDRSFSAEPFVPCDERVKRKRCEEILAIQSFGLKKRMECSGLKKVRMEIRENTDFLLALLVVVRTFDMLHIGREGIIITEPSGGRSTEEQLTETDEITIVTNDMTDFAMGRVDASGSLPCVYGVNVGVPKTLVGHLLKYYEDTCKKGVLPEMIKKYRSMSVGTDDLHDFFLYYMLRYGYSPSKIYRVGRETFGNVYNEAVILQELKCFYKCFFERQMKTSVMPDGPKVGSVSISPGEDLRMPSDACVRIWMEEIS